MQNEIQNKHAVTENYETLLMQELSRRHIEYVADCIGNDEQKFDRLMRVVLSGKEPVVQRAAWTMDVCVEKNHELLSPFVEILIDALPRFCNNSVKRQVVKALTTRKIPEKFEGQMVDLCFSWMQSPDVPVAIKVHCMQIIDNTSKQYPDLARELRSVIKEQLPRNTAGFASRGRKILKSHYRLENNGKNRTD